MNAPRSRPQLAVLVFPVMLPFVPPVRVGKRMPTPPFEWPAVFWHPGPPSTTSSTLSSGPEGVWTTVLRMDLVQETVFVVTWVALSWPKPWKPSKAPLNRSVFPPSSVMDEEEDEDEDEDEEEP